MMQDIGSISNEIDLDRQSTSAYKKAPKLVYCGDGVLEEYSDEENSVENEGDSPDTVATEKQETQVDTQNLQWVPWVKHYATVCASKSLSACDFMGEKLAWWLGITQPKYLYEIEEYNRMKQKYEISDDEDDENDHNTMANNNNNNQIQFEMNPLNSMPSTAETVIQINNENLFQSN